MGCDIHISVEVKPRHPMQAYNTDTKTWEDVTWEQVKFPWVIDPWGHMPSPVDDTVDIRWQPYIGRNYLLFALLANVRNNYGVLPIIPERGRPDGWVEPAGWAAEHSETWYTLEELLDFGWSNEVYEGGLDAWYQALTMIEDKLGEIPTKHIRLVIGFDN